MTSPLLQTTGLTRYYPGVRALDRVDFELARGEVHVLFGENGAGKSTLITLLSGAQPPTAGKILFEGREITLGSVRAARAYGISGVFQEFSLVPTLSVADNIFLGAEPRRWAFVNRRQVRSRAVTLLRELQFELDPDRMVGLMPRAEQQMVEIAKGFRSKPQVLILDEPTASLTDLETDRLFTLVERIKASGAGVIYITHRMQEIRRIADRVTVLRDGRKIGTVDAKLCSDEQLIEMMTGRAVSEVYPTITNKPAEELLRIENVTTASGVRGASLNVHRGEVVGVAGLVGSGKSELLRAAFGLDRVTFGRVVFKGRDITHARPHRLLDSGMFYLPPDRKLEGLVLPFSSRDNIALSALAKRVKGPFGLVSRIARDLVVERAAKAVDLAERNVGRTVGLLSGGNQQKVLFAKGLALDVDLYVLDEPTVGVDVGTRTSLYALVKRLCESGAGVVVISSDLPEVLNLSHRLYVMRRGEVAGELLGDDIEESRVLGLFFDRGAKAA